ncbi:helix-turn-helix transcriptional regulator [Streptomyces cyaneofuscatus]|uniref:helix-turn-helix transcriptional regulator n=1 Tax=Streptomyces cyaneofuscatus TaxID=66883 RepID=UPI0034309E6A
MCRTTDADRADGMDGLCQPALRLYAHALREGGIPRADLVQAPCLLTRNLVGPDPDDENRLRPIPASAAFTHLLKPFAQDVFERLDATATLVDALMPLTSIADRAPNPAITVIEGRERVIAALGEASRTARDEVLTAQPGGNRLVDNIRQGLANAHAVIAAGGHMRHLYQHPVRYSTRFTQYLDQLPPGHLEVRTMEQAIDRLIVFDRKVAYIPAAPGNNTALQIRHPALVHYLVHVYEVLWAQATPYDQPLPTMTPGAPVTAVQLSIARLLTEGHADEAIARKMGISVRTCRSHIAKLMQTLDATSRTHLGALLVRSGIARANPREPLT